jgi:magnesium chelatase family protein
VFSRALQGVSAPEIQVEVHSSNGLPNISLVGLPETSVKESRDRVRSALAANGFALPPKRITVNLAPADLPKQGSRYDLAIALGVLAATGTLTFSRDLQGFEFLGELSLDGRLRPVPGMLPAVIHASQNDRCVVVPNESLAECAQVSGAEVLGASHLNDVCGFLLEQTELDQPDAAMKQTPEPVYAQDMADVQGQLQAKRVLEICASGGHSLLMVGPPGSGKSMLAERFPTILPPLAEEQALELAAIHSVAGKERGPEGFYRRHFESPHHSATAAAMIGGGSGSVIQPGAISLAHHSVLFLDELPEFQRPVLEALREPLETGTVQITRVNQKVQFPAKVQLLCAMNPTPSGFFADDPQGRCKDTPEQIARYQRKLSGPLMDRIDCHLEVPAVEYADLAGQNSEENVETSSTIRDRVANCQARQQARQGCLNAQVPVSAMQKNWPLDDTTHALLEKAMDRLGLSARGYHRILRVARTLADMRGRKNIGIEEVSEALSYRRLDRWGANS